MNTEFHPRTSGHRGYSLIGNIGQEKSEKRYQKHMSKKTNKQGHKSDFIQYLLSNHMPSMSKWRFG